MHPALEEGRPSQAGVNGEVAFLQNGGRENGLRTQAL